MSEERNTAGTDRPGPSRRGLLKAGAVAGAVAGTGAWRAAAGTGHSGSVDAALRALGRRHLRRPGSLPYPHLPMGTDTIPQIEHIVIAMQENHSYDNRLGMLRRPGADGFRLNSRGQPTATNPYANGAIQHAFHMPTTCQLSGMPAQDWLASHVQFNNGRNDGFVKSGSGPVAMGYWGAADQPFYYSVAQIFPLADRYFCSVLGQTFPNRRYLMASTSIGQVDDTFPNQSDYPANGTIFDKLDAANITWRDYYTTLPTTLLFPPLYEKNHGTRVIPVAQFFTDAAAGKLPGFCFVEPDFGNQSEENPQNIVLGEQFVAQVVSAVMNGPAWHKTLLIWTYDEHGGYYDHVTPPPALAPDNIPPAPPPNQSLYNGFAQYGFRVPTVFVSPWARPDYVSHQLFDHSSICALVEAKWNLPAMTLRDANANNMLDLLDLRRPAFLHPPTLAKPLAGTDPTSLTCSTTGPGQIPPPGSVTPPPHR